MFQVIINVQHSTYIRLMIGCIKLFIQVGIEHQSERLINAVILWHYRNLNRWLLYIHAVILSCFCASFLSAVIISFCTAWSNCHTKLMWQLRKNKNKEFERLEGKSECQDSCTSEVLQNNEECLFLYPDSICMAYRKDSILQLPRNSLHSLNWCDSSKNTSYYGTWE